MSLECEFPRHFLLLQPDLCASMIAIAIQIVILAALGIAAATNPKPGTITIPLSRRVGSIKTGPNGVFDMEFAERDRTQVLRKYAVRSPSAAGTRGVNDRAIKRSEDANANSKRISRRSTGKEALTDDYDGIDECESSWRHRLAHAF